MFMAKRLLAFSVLAMLATSAAAEAPQELVPRLDGSVSEQPISGPPFPHPTDLPRGRDLWARVECTVTVEGFTKDCVVVDRNGGSAIVEVALDYVSHSRYVPAVSNGVVIETRHRWVIRLPSADR
jgi:hypothetical protein